MAPRIKIVGKAETPTPKTTPEVVPKTPPEVAPKTPPVTIAKPSEKFDLSKFKSKQ